MHQLTDAPAFPQAGDLPIPVILDSATNGTPQPGSSLPAPRGTLPDRLPFKMHDFTRRIWNSAEARATWEPRMQRITKAWAEIERRSVVTGIRGAALVSMTPEQFIIDSEWAMMNGIYLLPLQQQSRSGEYSASSRGVQQGQPWDYRAVFVRAGLAPSWWRAWRNSDNKAMGSMLGYPACCVEFFQRYWVKESRVDTTWAMAQGEDGVRHVDVRDASPASMILLRWLGIRMVPHLPCCFSCVTTEQFGKLFVELGNRLGFTEEMEWLCEMHTWPVEWAALHGIAEIKTPIVKVSASTDSTGHKYTVHVHGTGYPVEGARGIRFPYKSVKEMKLVQLKNRQPRTVTIVDSNAEYNGFTNLETMHEAHSTVLAAVPNIRELNIQSIVDLGCGDATLLWKVGLVSRAMQLVGVEVDPVRAAAAHKFLSDRDTHPQRTFIIATADFTKNREVLKSKWDLVILMPGRLLEVDEEDAREVRQLLCDNARYVLMYAYGDWLDRNQNLAALVGAAFYKTDYVITSHSGATAADGLRVEAELTTISKKG